MVIISFVRLILEPRNVYYKNPDDLPTTRTFRLNAFFFSSAEAIFNNIICIVRQRICAVSLKGKKFVCYYYCYKYTQVILARVRQLWLYSQFGKIESLLDCINFTGWQKDGLLYEFRSDLCEAKIHLLSIFPMTMGYELSIKSNEFS